MYILTFAGLIKAKSAKVKFTGNMFSKFYPDFIPIYLYKVSGVRIQLPDASELTPRVKLQRNGFDFIFLDRIYRIDGIFYAFGEGPFRPKAVLSR